MRSQEEEALDLVEVVRDLCKEFEFKFPAHSVGRDPAGIAMIAERPPRETVKALWLPMVFRANHRGLNAEYLETEQNGVQFSAIYVRLPPPILGGISVFGDGLSFWHMACENMLWTHDPSSIGASGIAVKGPTDG